MALVLSIHGKRWLLSWHLGTKPGSWPPASSGITAGWMPNITLGYPETPEGRITLQGNFVLS